MSNSERCKSSSSLFTSSAIPPSESNETSVVNRRIGCGEKGRAFLGLLKSVEKTLSVSPLVPCLWSVATAARDWYRSASINRLSLLAWPGLEVSDAASARMLFGGRMEKSFAVSALPPAPPRCVPSSSGANRSWPFSRSSSRPPPLQPFLARLSKMSTSALTRLQLASTILPLVSWLSLRSDLAWSA